MDTILTLINVTSPLRSRGATASSDKAIEVGLLFFKLNSDDEEKLERHRDYEENGKDSTVH